MGQRKVSAVYSNLDTDFDDLKLMPYQASVIHGRCAKALRAKNLKDTIGWEPREKWAVLKTLMDDLTALSGE